MYAATPPLEALRLLTVKLASREQHRRGAKIAPDDDNSSVMTHVDVHRAYFYALGQCGVRNEASGTGVAGRSGEGAARSKNESRSIVAGFSSMWTGEASLTVTISSLRRDCGRPRRLRSTCAASGT